LQEGEGSTFLAINDNIMKVLGVDPGFGRVGFAVLESQNNNQHIRYSDCFSTSAKTTFHKRLACIGEETERLIESFKPDVLAIETLFFNTNQKTALQVAEARGVIQYMAARQNIPIHEYTPLQVKIAITGYGLGTKAQVIAMLHRLLSIEERERYDDEYDAIAIALTCLVSTPHSGH
jgi:crossover junction endodeoxyribonuclease RuvC